jgi:hypothetical protein
MILQLLTGLPLLESCQDVNQHCPYHVFVAQPGTVSKPSAAEPPALVANDVGAVEVYAGALQCTVPAVQM